MGIKIEGKTHRGQTIILHLRAKPFCLYFVAADDYGGVCGGQLFHSSKRTNYQFYQQQLSKEESMRKISQPPSQVPPLFEPAKTHSHSLSTQESPRERLPAPSHKEKSQLCKKFVEQGYCPYERRCKFAHGLQELKKNHQANCKYKTKVCGGFLQDGFCPYGNRCNFIHPPSAPSRTHELNATVVAIRLQGGGQSRLLRLLQME